MLRCVTFGEVIIFIISFASFNSVAPWLPLPEEDAEFKKFKDETAQFICAAQGNPLEVEWKVRRKGEDTVQACISK